jgi:redox-sensitive bicupin YhaK (pirin superfamily)
MVQFHDFREETSVDGWRLIAGPGEAPLAVRSDVRVFDARISDGVELRLPATEAGRDILLYVFSGKIALGNENISEGESLFTAGLDSHPTGLEASDVVLFSIDTKAEVYRGGMFSGNQRRRSR